MKIRGKEIEIDARKFYLIGIVAFGFVAISTTATILQTYKMFIPTQLISQIASNVFNYALWGFFLYLYRQLPPKDLPLATDKDMEDILKLAAKEK